MNPFTGGSTGCLNCGTDAAVLLRTCQSCTGDDWPVSQVINLTPHEINIVGEGGSVERTLPPSGSVARVEVRATQVGHVFCEGLAVALRKTEFGQVVDLPPPVSGYYFVVSRVVLEAARAVSRGADDLVCPDDLVRDAEGRVIGARAFSQ